eukprot:3435319-Prymnesium_polylepis.1
MKKRQFFICLKQTYREFTFSEQLLFSFAAAYGCGDAGERARPDRSARRAAARVRAPLRVGAGRAGRALSSRHRALAAQRLWRSRR